MEGMEDLLSAQLSPPLQPRGKSHSVVFDPETRLAEYYCYCFHCDRILEFSCNLFWLTDDENYRSFL